MMPEKLSLKQYSCLILITVFILPLAGCSTIGPSASPSNNDIMRGYFKINKLDGINQKEALQLAKSEIIFRGHTGEYDMDRPQCVEEKSLWKIKFDPINKTLGDWLKKRVLFVTVDKANGAVQWMPVFKQ